MRSDTRQSLYGGRRPLNIGKCLTLVVASGRPSRSAVAAMIRSAVPTPPWLLRSWRPNSPAVRPTSSSTETQRSCWNSRSAGRRSSLRSPRSTSTRVTSEQTPTSSSSSTYATADGCPRKTSMRTVVSRTALIDAADPPERVLVARLRGGAPQHSVVPLAADEPNPRHREPLHGTPAAACSRPEAQPSRHRPPHG